jgi:hypothetical protein
MLTDKQKAIIVNSILKEFNQEEQREMGSRYLANKIEQGVRFGCSEIEFRRRKEVEKYNGP